MKENKNAFISFVLVLCFIFILHAAYIEIHAFKSLFTLLFAVMSVISYAYLLNEHFKKKD